MDAYVGEIRSVGFNYAPPDWALCDGSLLKISDYEALYTLIGLTYGGDGQTTFGLPDLRGRVPVHMGTAGGTTYPAGQIMGSESVTLQSQQVGSHAHALLTGTAANSGVPSASTVLADVGAATVPSVFGAAANLTSLASQSIGTNVGSQPHENRQPLLAINYIIATAGLYPTQN